MLLDEDRREASFAGIEVSLAKRYRGPYPIAVKVDCFGSSGTPALAIDPGRYGADALLMNVTRQSDHDCASYRVALISDAADGTAAPVESITVAVHYSGPVKADKRLSEPAAFVFNPVRGNWAEAKGYTPPKSEPHRVYATLAEHTSRIISGVIALPDPLQSEPARAQPASLTQSLEQVSPSDGYLSVDKIEPDSKGAYSVNLPLLLRPSRGPGPSFSIGYSSQGVTGALGRGWDLSISTIEVRGPSPLYHPDYETEDYVLDGMDLIALDGEGKDIPPLYKGGPIIPRIKQERLFRPRNTSGGLIVRRHGDRLEEYFWEVWDPNSHVTRLYGGELENGKDRPNSTKEGRLSGTAVSSGYQRGVAGQWSLTQEYDNQLAKTGAIYTYASTGCDPMWEQGCSAALRLDTVEYNRSFGPSSDVIPTEGKTKVKFSWEKRKSQRFSSDGRLGFFRAHEYWLTGVTVTYQPNNQWLVNASTEDKDPRLGTGEALFADHRFDAGGSETNACMNYDRVLKSYTVSANTHLDRDYDAPLNAQTFTFKYDGEQHGAECERTWERSVPYASNELGMLPAEAPKGFLRSPSEMLKNLGFGLLAGQSLLGTGATEETGASLYVGIGPPGDPYTKEQTFGLKAAMNFSRSELNSTLVDVTGDGIDDIVYRVGDQLLYCGGERSPGTSISASGSTRYPDKLCGKIEGITDFSVSSSSTRSIGVEGFSASESFAGAALNTTKSDTYVYFTDRDGDGLIDVAAFGQVLYGQGEVLVNQIVGNQTKEERIVRFVPDSALTPPLPGGEDAVEDLGARTPLMLLPEELKRTIGDIEAQLAQTSSRIRELKYSQTTLAWEAPLTGKVVLSKGIAGDVDGADDEVMLRPRPEDFEESDANSIYVETVKLQPYVDQKLACIKWPERDHCHQQASNPLGPQYVPLERNIAFLSAPPAQVRVSVYRRSLNAVVNCGEREIGAYFDLAKLLLAENCRAPKTENAYEIQIETGDVVYITYNIHPHLAKWVRPSAHIAYTHVDHDWAFNAFKSPDTASLVALLTCKWKDMQAKGEDDRCLLSRQTRYEFDLEEAIVPSSPSATVELQRGSVRAFGGKFQIDSDLTRDYRVFFDVSAAKKTVTNKASAFPASSLPGLFRHDISASCAAASGDTCTVELPAQLECTSKKAECDAFWAADADAYVVASRLVIEHRISGAILPPRHLTGRLGSLKWLKPPHVASILKERHEVAGPAGKEFGGRDRAVMVYLPVATGEPDIEYARVIQGRFANPDVDLNEGEPSNPQRISFGTILGHEEPNVTLAKVRQTLALCDFAEEIVNFLEDRHHSDGQPFVEDYFSFWASRLDEYRRNPKQPATDISQRKRCDVARQYLKGTKFTNGHGPEHESGNGLRLPILLRDLTYAEQTSSAETLVERVFLKLELGQDVLIDHPRLTRRGYRLPVKANPLDCYILRQGIRPLPSPLYSIDDVGTCAYRVSTNFAMQDFEEALEGNPGQADLLRRMMAPFKDSGAPAFKIELQATVNGEPLQFRELAGAGTGNFKCDFAEAQRSCIGTYGTITPESYFHPKSRGRLGANPSPSEPAPPGSDVGVAEPAMRRTGPHGDVFQRITTNKRTGRAVAFSNSIMDDVAKARCPQAYPTYRNQAEMEAKQECSLPEVGGSKEVLKYVGKPTYSVDYFILENNQFVGRNRIFEFDAAPLDVVEFHYRLIPIERVAEADDVKGAKVSLNGNFSILEAKAGSKLPFIELGRHFIPRSPSDILPGGPNLSCAELPGRKGRLPATCRPWTKLAWTEVFLGAQYRTYSDAALTGLPITYSIKRRREILRLQPEIEVAADQYSLEVSATEDPEGAPEKVGEPTKFVFPRDKELRDGLLAISPVTTAATEPASRVATISSRFRWKSGDAWVIALAPLFAWIRPVLAMPLNAPVTAMTELKAPTEYLLFYSRDPVVAKTGADWALFAGAAEKHGGLREPPSFRDLRFSTQYAPPVKRMENNAYENASTQCGGAGNPNYDGCELYLGAEGDHALSLGGLEFFGLSHRFVGPPLKAEAQAVFKSQASAAFGSCATEAPKTFSSCWKGVDDTISLEAALSPLDEEIYSVSALLGFERPPLVEFAFEFDALKRIACLDHELVASDPALCASALQPHPGLETEDAARRTSSNRPMPPPASRMLRVFAPIQTSRMKSVSTNVGLSKFNANASGATRSTATTFVDVNGDGYPDPIVGGVAEMTSPVGIARRDWWRYFRVEETPPLSFGLNVPGYAQGALSIHAGAGVGLSPPTAANDASGSPDPKIDPSFDLSLAGGFDQRFTELRDFNGDGLADSITGTFVGSDLKLRLNAGGRLRPQTAGSMQVDGRPIFGLPFNTNHTAGFGVRLGFTWGAGSHGFGSGLSHEDNGSQAALMDFTGDGRPDIVLPSGRNIIVFPNLGNGFGPAKIHSLSSWVGRSTEFNETTILDTGGYFTAGFTTPFFKIVFSPAGKGSQSQTRELLNIRDVNADGAPDLVTVTGRFQGLLNSLLGGDLATEVHYNPEARYHLLTAVENPAGSKWILSHGLYGNSGPEHGHAVWALKAAARYDGFEPLKTGNTDASLAPDGQDLLVSVYDYADGYYNRAERQFYGFGKRTTTLYGCDVGAREKCLDIVNNVSLVDLDGAMPSLDRLQLVRQEFANRDFLTQGLLLSELVGGTESGKSAKDKVNSKAVSNTVFRYSIDKPFSLAGDGSCIAHDFGDSWNITTFAANTSALKCAWDGSTVLANRPVFGGEDRSICRAGVESCAETLRLEAEATGFKQEQRAYWAQRSGAVRQRLIALETFATERLACTVDGESAPTERATASCLVNEQADRLRSAVAFDHDQWGQVLALDSIGEASAIWKPTPGSTAHAVVSYAGTKKTNARPGYPLLGLVANIQIFDGPWKGAEDAGTAPLRAREAEYSTDGRGNMTDICLYPGGAGFVFQPGICETFRDDMKAALRDGYSTIQSALRKAYDRAGGLPDGASDFNAIIHHQLTEYDAFGNLKHAISPLSQNRDWIERRFDYSADPFRRSATQTALTRCIEDIAGAGTNSPNLPKDAEGRPDNRLSNCTFSLGTDLPEQVRSTAVTHYSASRIDGHFGTVAEVEDINANSLLYDFDRWGRLRFIARSWGKAARENSTFKALIELAGQKSGDGQGGHAEKAKSWNILALADYDGSVPGALRSNLRHFENSDAYAGLLGGRNTTRETATFSDGLGRPIQSLREADVCINAMPKAFDGETGTVAAGFGGRCESQATAVAAPATAIDALGRELASFEAYPAAVSERKGSALRFLKLVDVPQLPMDDGKPWAFNPVAETTYDGAGRPLVVESRLAEAADDPNRPGVRGTAQYHYRIVAGQGDRASRFEALSLSPRCTASAAWSDARGLTSTVFEDQDRFYPSNAQLNLADPTPGPYTRNHDLTRGFCDRIETIVRDWSVAAVASESKKDSTPQPSRVSYLYDPLQQLISVDSPLAGYARAKIGVRFDLLGRTVELNEPNSGCTRYAYDGLNTLTSESGFRYEASNDNCGASSHVRNEKAYKYSGGRLIEMAYRSLEEQAGAADARDTVRFYYDRYPHAGQRGELLEALRYVDNDLASQRFVDTTGLECDNCIGQATLLTDRTGARSFSFNELGLVRRELRSILAPLTQVVRSKGESETDTPEVAFYEQENSYTAFGDPVTEEFSESAPQNPSQKCVDGGIETCLARFSVGRRYAPDGSVAELRFNGRPLISAAQDALGRPSIRWTADGVVSGYRYDPVDLRLNQMATLTGSEKEVQRNGYQYDGGGNIVAHANRPDGDYESGFAFAYDAVNRLTGFNAAARNAGQHMASRGRYDYDTAHRFAGRCLEVLPASTAGNWLADPCAEGAAGTGFLRQWTFDYGKTPANVPAHAPQTIDFALNRAPAIATAFTYDDLGRMTRIASGESGAPLLSSRALSWDAAGRLARVRGVGANDNAPFLREDYVYDSGGNRTLKIHRPRLANDHGQPTEGETATIYMTPFYARSHDGLGSVQLSQGSLPAASLTPPADENSEPLVTYLYSDLPVGSMTAAVTVLGEADNADAISMSRREYEPYGLELTSDALAAVKDRDVPPLSVFHGKELDRITNFSSFGARYYSRDLGIWLSPDPMMAGYLDGNPGEGVFKSTNMAAFSAFFNNPITFNDASGLCAEPSDKPQICAMPDTFWNRHPTLGKILGDPFALLPWNYHGGIAFNPLTKRELTPKEEQNEKIMLLVNAVFSVARALPAASKAMTSAPLLSKTINAETSILRSASEALGVAAKNADNFVVGNKHLASAGGNYAKFAEGINPNAILREALSSPNARIYPNDGASFKIIADVGRQVGTKGQTAVRAIVDYSGHVVTWFPVKP